MLTVLDFACGRQFSTDHSASMPMISGDGIDAICSDLAIEHVVAGAAGCHFLAPGESTTLWCLRQPPP